MKWPRYPGGRWVGFEVRSRFDILKWRWPEIYKGKWGPLYLTLGPISIWIEPAVEDR